MSTVLEILRDLVAVNGPSGAEEDVVRAVVRYLDGAVRLLSAFVMGLPETDLRFTILDGGEAGGA